MGDLKNPRLICLKGLLFLAAGVIAGATLLLDHPTLRTALLLILCVWSFARFYYFAFYVIEHYIESDLSLRGIDRFRALPRVAPAAWSLTAGYRD